MHRGIPAGAAVECRILSPRSSVIDANPQLCFSKVFFFLRGRASPAHPYLHGPYVGRAHTGTQEGRVHIFKLSIFDHRRLHKCYR